MFMERSQSRLSLSASFEALAIYFPCMNSFDEEDGGKDSHAILIFCAFLLRIHPPKGDGMVQVCCGLDHTIAAAGGATS